MALACGFGIDFEHCDPEILMAIEDRLATRQRRASREALAAEARRRFGS